ncbi:MAG: hypothetical protein RL199_145 [Pseudomonadota bacterium]|jgi:multidrug efflux pump subunit AcrA (membrane-fusion protein)
MRRFGWLLGLSVAWHGTGESAPAPATSRNASPRFVKARPAGDSPLWTASARLVAGPSDAPVVSMPVQGRVVSVRARAGDRLRRGDVLAEVVMPEVLKAAAEFEGARSRTAAGPHDRKASSRTGGICVREWKPGRIRTLFVWQGRG